MAKLRNRRCERCRFYLEFQTKGKCEIDGPWESYRGECRRYAKKPFPEACEWPEVERDDFCGEWSG